jgi:hypothetical protein
VTTSLIELLIPAKNQHVCQNISVPGESHKKQWIVFIYFILGVGVETLRNFWCQDYIANI